MASVRSNSSVGPPAALSRAFDFCSFFSFYAGYTIAVSDISQGQNNNKEGRLSLLQSFPPRLLLFPLSLSLSPTTGPYSFMKPLFSFGAPFSSKEEEEEEGRHEMGEWEVCSTQQQQPLPIFSFCFAGHDHTDPSSICLFC